MGKPTRAGRGRAGRGVKPPRADPATAEERLGSTAGERAESETAEPAAPGTTERSESRPSAAEPPPQSTRGGRPIGRGFQRARRRLKRWLRRQPAVLWFHRRVSPVRARRLLAGAFIAAAAFAIGAYVVAPYVVSRTIEDYGARAPGRSASAARVLVNPFTLTVTLVAPELADPRTGTSLDAEEVRLNFAFPTLLGRVVALDELAVRAPRVRVDVAQMGSEPIFDPARGPFAERIASAVGAVDPVRIGRLEVEAGRLELVADGADESSTFSDIEIEAEGLATDDEATGSYSVSSAVAVGSTASAGLRFDGAVSLAPPHARGRARVSGMALDALRPWFSPRLAEAAPTGRLDLEADYEYPAGAEGASPAVAATPPEWRLSNGEARIADAEVRLPTGVVARAPRASLRLDAARGGDALASARFSASAEEMTVLAVDEAGAAEPRTLAFADRAEADDVRLEAARAPEGTGWLLTAGLGRFVGLEAAVEIGGASSVEIGGASSVETGGASSVAIGGRPADATSPSTAVDSSSTAVDGPSAIDSPSAVPRGSTSPAAAVRTPIPVRRLLSWLARPELSSADATPETPVVVHRLELAEGRVELVDRGTTRPARIEATGLSGSITPGASADGASGESRDDRDSGDSGDSSDSRDSSRDSKDTGGESRGDAVAESRADLVRVSLSGGFTEGGTGSLDASFGRSVPAARAVALNLNGVSAAALAPYAERAVGRALDGGRVDLTFDCRAEAGQLSGTLELRGDELALTAGPLPPSAAPAGPTAADAPVTNAPTGPVTNEPPRSAPIANEPRPRAPALDLALALLTDPDGRSELTSALAAPDQLAGGCGPGVAAATLRSKLDAIVAAPFVTLAAVVGREPSSLRAVEFEPGAAEPSEAGIAALDALAEVLEDRPKLGLRVAGGYDPDVDRDALAVQEVELHVALETAGATLRVTPGPVDFTLPFAQKVLDEFAARQLSAEQRATIASEFDLHAGGGADVATRVAYYRAIFDALVENEPIQSGALARLGRFRAESIARQLEKRGIERERIGAALGGARSNGGGKGGAEAKDGAVAVPLEAAALPLESIGGPLGGGRSLPVPSESGTGQGSPID